MDVLGAALFGIALAPASSPDLIGSTEIAGTDLDPTTVSLALGVVAVLATVTAVVRRAARDDPFLDVRLFRSAVSARRPSSRC